MSPPAVQAPPRTIEAVERLRAVFTEIPGTVLSLGEASRLSGFEPDPVRTHSRRFCEHRISRLRRRWPLA
jgi:hypothetical protein